MNEEGYRDGDTPRGAPVEVVCVGGDSPPPEENADIMDFTSKLTHLLLRGVYGGFPNHNNGSHLDREVIDDAI